MKKFILSLITCISIVIPSFSFVNAATYTFNMPHSKPFAGDNAGYINVYYTNSSGDVSLRTIAWFWQPSDNTNQGKVVHSFVDVDVTSSKVTLEFRKPTTVAACELTFYAMGETWYNIYDSSGTYTSNTTQSYSPGNIIYVEMFGNIGTVTDPFYEKSYSFVVNWSDTYTSNSYLAELVDQLANQNVLTQDILDKLNDIYGSDIDISDSTNANNALGSVVGEYDGFEQDFNNNLNSSMNDLDTDILLYGVSDFVKTGSFVSTQLTNIFNSNQMINNMTIFSLVIGFSLVLIGIGVKR